VKGNSYTELPAQSVLVACKRTIDGITSSRQRQVDALVDDVIEKSSRPRLFGLIRPKPLDRIEAMTVLKDSGGFDLFWARRAYAGQYRTAQRLLELATASLSSGGFVYVSADDFYAISHAYEVTK